MSAAAAALRDCADSAEPAQDWDLLFDAVTARLQDGVAAERLAPGRQVPANAVPGIGPQTTA
jgi:hypothetical protein